MRRFTVLSLFLACSMSATVQAQPRVEDERAIRQLIAEHWTASQTGDFDGLVGGYREDSDLRWADGVLVEGLPGIRKQYAEVLRNGSQVMAHHHPDETVRIRFLSEDIAFADIDSVPGLLDPDREAAAAPATTSIFVVFTKVDGEWGVAIERQGATIR